jgi:hypothetical protein
MIIGIISFIGGYVSAILMVRGAIRRMSTGEELNCEW